MKTPSITKRVADKMRREASKIEDVEQKAYREAIALRKKIAILRCPFEVGDIVIGGEFHRIKGTVVSVCATSRGSEYPWMLKVRRWTARNKEGKAIEKLCKINCIRISSAEERL